MHVYIRAGDKAGEVNITGIIKTEKLDLVEKARDFSDGPKSRSSILFIERGVVQFACIGIGR